MSAVQAPVRIIDGDGHILEDQREMLKFLPPPYQGSEHKARLLQIFPYLDHLRDGQAPFLVPPGSFRRVDAEAWSEFLDNVGIESAVL
ncbi:MAG TPA: hypothetical protein VNL15_01915, partial [Dehalococcoidia bacterium]|nr:hypothetical protein [Dehalococcoidia bacterium]